MIHLVQNREILGSRQDWRMNCKLICISHKLFRWEKIQTGNNKSTIWKTGFKTVRNTHCYTSPLLPLCGEDTETSRANMWTLDNNQSCLTLEYSFSKLYYSYVILWTLNLYQQKMDKLEHSVIKKNENWYILQCGWILNILG